MLTITKKLDMSPHGVPQVIRVSQYDSDFTLEFKLFASGGNFAISTGTTAEIRGTKQSGTGYSASATLDTSTKVVTVAGAAQMTAVAGMNIFEIVLKKNNKEISSANFCLLVERAALDADTITDESVLKELNAIIESADTATQAAEEAEAAADRAEAAAQSLVIDSTPTQGSAHAVGSGGMYEALKELEDDASQITAINKQTITDDLNIIDENGYVIASFANGHIKTKNFDSSDIETETTVDAEELPVGDDLNIVDDDCYSIVTFADGHIKTKNFDSREALTLANTRYYGAKISVLGDSISSFNGFSPSTWNPYYPTYGPDVDSVSKMWFSIVADAIGGSVLASASWGASGVCGNSEDSTGNVGCSSARIAALATNSVIPDIIFIEMGTNDWSSNRTIGGFNENSELPANGTITDFSQAYAKMLSRIMSTYPLAAVFCMTISARLTNADSTFPIKNSNGITIPAFNAEIRKIANIFGAKVININSCGMSVYNLSIYAGEHQLHPNAAGHNLMAKEVISKLLK